MSGLASRAGQLGRRGGPAWLRRGAANLRWISYGIGAIGTKELLGRMRGRRAFVIITIHLLLVAGFALLVQGLMVNAMASGFSGTTSADVGRGLFIGLVALLTLIVLVLAPGSTAGAISLEREKQTLDMLATTPVSSIGIVLGKLLASVGWIYLLLAASLPVMALVFTYGGVAPDDLVRAYVVLAAATFCYGSMGLFISALLKRTQASTLVNLVLAIGLTGGTAGLYLVGAATAYSDAAQAASQTNQQVSWADVKVPPAAMLWVNPIVSQIDVVCGTDTTFSPACSVVLVITGRFDILQNTNTGISSGDTLGMPRDSYWPRGVATMLAIGVALVLASSQLISPTRRWRRPHPQLAWRRRSASVEGASAAPDGNPDATGTVPATALTVSEPDADHWSASSTSDGVDHDGGRA